MRKRFIGLFIGRAAQFLLALATVRVATSLLPPVEMGRVSLTVTTTGFFVFLLVNPVGMFINRRLHDWHANQVARHHLLQFAVYLVGVAAIAAMSLPVLQATKVVDFGVPLGWLIGLVCGSLIFYPINNTAIPLLNLLGHGGAFIALSVATVAAGLLFAASLVLYLRPSAQCWLIGIMLGQAAVGFLGAKILFKHLPPPAVGARLSGVKRREIHALFHFVWPVSIAAVLGWVQSQGYRYVIEGQLGLKVLGLFVVGYGISMGIIAAFESVMTAYFQPQLYRDASSSEADIRARAWARYGEALIPSLLLTTGLIIIVAPELAKLFLGQNYQSAAVYVVWGALADTARAVVAVYSLIAHVKVQTRWLLLPNILGAFLSIVLCVALIPKSGAAGAGLGLVISGFAVVGAMHFLFARHTGDVAIVRPIGLAVVMVAVLWGVAVLLRDLANGSAWWSSFAVLVPVCVLFLSFQYVCLRSHVTNAVLVGSP